MSNDNEPVLEMIDPALGYVSGNVIVISRLASVTVNKMTPEERKLVLEKAKAGIPAAKA